MSTVIAITSLAQAHERRPGVADITVTGDEMRVELRMLGEAFLAGIDLRTYADTNSAPQSATYDDLRALPAEVLATKMRDAWPRLRDEITLGGTSAPAELLDVSVEDGLALELPRETTVVFAASLPPGDAPVTLSWAPTNGSLIARMGIGEGTYGAFLNPGETTEDLPRNAVVKEGTAQVILRFVLSGFDHIIPKGLDHILFVLGLFFFALASSALLWQVTAFTLAHTVTLALASLGIIGIPPAWMWLVEALIALSITWIAVENILRPQLGWWRPAVVFGFGLLHGLGFASVLADFGLSQGKFIVSLISFNVGVELGQLAVISMAFGLLVLARSLAKHAAQDVTETPVQSLHVIYRAVSIVGSLLIAIIGFYWFIERAFLG